MAVTISNNEIQAINMFEARTGARANDVVFTDDTVIFMVQKGDLGRAIGRNGATIMGLKKALDKEVELVESADTLEGLLANLFRPAQVTEVRLEERDGKKVAVVKVDAKSKGLAIGKGGKRINSARIIAKRCFDCDEVRLA